MTRSKVLLVIVCGLLFSFGATAGVITQNCIPFPGQIQNGIGSGSASCPAFNVAGAQTLDSVTLLLFADYQFGTNLSGTPNIIEVTFNLSNPSGVGWSSSSQPIDVSGFFSSSSTSPTVPTLVSAISGVSLVAFSSAFNVGVTSAVLQGGADASSYGVQVQYNYSNNTPEPAVFTLLGSGLVCLGLIGRKRLRR